MDKYDEIRKEHSIKRFNEIAALFGERNPIYDLNTALIDEDSRKIEICEAKLGLLGHEYSFKDLDYLKGKEKFIIAYLLPHNHITGGLKILIEQANNLRDRGHNVLLFSHVPKPDWIDVRCKYFLVPPEKSLYEVIPYADIVIAGYWDLIIDALKTNAPLRYYIAQGDIDIFEYDRLNPLYRNIAVTAHELPVRILTVSKLMQIKIKELYKRNSVLIPNAIDDKIFYPEYNKGNNPPEILIIGNDSLNFKGHDDIIRALFALKNDGCNFRVRWAMPNFPTKDYTSAKLNIQYIIRPTQEELGRLYRTSDLYISASYYESFSLPPLEAMASATAVITASNEGVKEYAVDGENCLMFEPGNVKQLIEKTKYLLESVELREKLSEQGLKTAKGYSWGHSVDLLEEEFYKAIKKLRIAVLEQ